MPVTHPHGVVMEPADGIVVDNDIVDHGHIDHDEHDVGTTTLEIAMHADKIANLNRLQKRIVRGKLRGNAIDDQNVAVDCFDGTFQRDSRTSCGHCRNAGDVAHHGSHDNPGAAECTFHVDDIANVNNGQN